VFKGHDRVLMAAAAPPAAGEAAPAAPAADGGGAPAAAAGAPQVAGPRVRDEIREYQDCRYVSASEAAWRLLAFDMHREQPNVMRLAVHLPDQQTVVFNPDPSPHNPHSGLESVNAKTSLTSWFAFNKKVKADAEMWAAVAARGNHPNGAARAEAAEARALWDECQNTLYHNFPKIATLNNKVWKRRERRMARNPVGRMYYVPPSAGERFYLRLCLTHVPGATCFEDVRTFQGRVCATFKEAAIARGLLQDDGEWRAALEGGGFLCQRRAAAGVVCQYPRFQRSDRPPRSVGRVQRANG
jgi:hypothetical protein